MVLAWALVLAIGMPPQSAASSCPADLPVDDLIAEMQSKKARRSKNPLPDDFCIGSWCSRIKKPDSHRRRSQQEASKTEAQPADTSGESSSKTPEAKCDAAMEVALSAAHNVEVGDFNFERKNYRGAFLRYSDALAAKSQDAAIHVRLGRVLERLNDPGEAMEHYQAALKLAAPANWAEEARAALARLQK